ncbi:MAG: GxxExxY protein [Desulfobacterales bacterium]|nr:GxxExxY protein [Desulfobacterales bacterium]
MSNLLYENLSYKIIGAAREVYKELGPGYLESVYEDALCYELDLLSIEYFHPIDYGLVGRSPGRLCPISNLRGCLWKLFRPRSLVTIFYKINR